MSISSCPCCGNSQLLRHARRNQLFWLCTSCRQEVIPLSVGSLQQQVGIQRNHLASASK